MLTASLGTRLILPSCVWTGCFTLLWTSWAWAWTPKVSREVEACTSALLLPEAVSQPGLQIHKSVRMETCWRPSVVSHCHLVRDTSTAAKHKSSGIRSVGLVGLNISVHLTDRLMLWSMDFQKILIDTRLWLETIVHSFLVVVCSFFTRSIWIIYIIIFDPLHYPHSPKMHFCKKPRIASVANSNTGEVMTNGMAINGLIAEWAVLQGDLRVWNLPLLAEISKWCLSYWYWGRTSPGKNHLTKQGQFSAWVPKDRATNFSSESASAFPSIWKTAKWICLGN